MFYKEGRNGYFQNLYISVVFRIFVIDTTVQQTRVQDRDGGLSTHSNRTQGFERLGIKGEDISLLRWRVVCVCFLHK